MQTVTAQRGETCVWLLVTPVGTDVAGWEVSSWARIYRPRRGVTSGAPAAMLEVSEFAGDGDLGPGWYLTLPADACADLAPLTYQLDARIEHSGDVVVIADSWLLKLVEPVTGASA